MKLKKNNDEKLKSFFDNIITSDDNFIINNVHDHWYDTWPDMLHHYLNFKNCPKDCIYIAYPKIYRGAKFPQCIHGCYYDIIQRKIIKRFAYEYIFDDQDLEKKILCSVKPFSKLALYYSKVEEFQIGFSSNELKKKYLEIINKEFNYKVPLYFKTISFEFFLENNSFFTKDIKKCFKKIPEQDSRYLDDLLTIISFHCLEQRWAVTHRSILPIVCGLSSPIISHYRDSNYIPTEYILEHWGKFGATSESIDRIKKGDTKEPDLFLAKMRYEIFKEDYKKKS